MASVYLGQNIKTYFIDISILIQMPHKTITKKKNQSFPITNTAALKINTYWRKKTPICEIHIYMNHIDAFLMTQKHTINTESCERSVFPVVIKIHSLHLSKTSASPPPQATHGRGTSYLKMTLKSFPPRRSASQEFLMTASLRLSHASAA